METVQLTSELMAYFHIAAQFAQKSTCKKAHCGCILVKDGRVIAGGYNAPPLGDVENQKCDYVYPAKRKRPQNDCTCCVHAEWRAIIDALRSGNSADLVGSTLYFTRVDEFGKKYFAPEKYTPHCTVCSRLGLDAGISTWVLWGDPEPVMYGAKEYNDLSYQFHLNE